MSYSTAFSQAVCIMLYVHTKIKDEHFEYLSTKRIAESLNIPTPTATKVIRKLNEAGLLNSKTGIDGGMSLTKGIENITLYDVFKAVEQGKPLFRVHTSYNISGERVEHAKKNLLNAIEQTEESMCKSLKGVTLMDLL